MTELIWENYHPTVCWLLLISCHLITVCQHYFLDPSLYLKGTPCGDWLRKYEAHLEPWMKQIGSLFQRETNQSQRKKIAQYFPDFAAVHGALSISLYKICKTNASITQEAENPLIVYTERAAVCAFQVLNIHLIVYHSCLVHGSEQYSPRPSRPAYSEDQTWMCQAHTSHHSNGSYD